MSAAFPPAVPEIPVRDIATAAAYYRDRLAFTLDWGDDALGLAGISRGDCRMFLASEEYRKQRGTVGPSLVWLNLASREEVDELYRAWSSSDAELVSAPESRAWGLHEFTAADADGNLPPRLLRLAHARTRRVRSRMSASSDHHSPLNPPER